ncbi:5'-3' exonuclease [Jatrophihabitans sp. YIM 134969]
MLVDAASMYFRAFHGVPTSVTNDEGQPVNAIRGYLDMTAQLIRTRKPSDYVACLDLDWRPQFRIDLVPSYKAHRATIEGGEMVETVPDELSPQVPVLLAVLKALGLGVAGAEGFEADDVIATLAARADAEAVATEIVTGDRDLMALATQHVRVLYTGKGVSKLEDLGPAEIETKYGVLPPRYADLAVLRGDPSDGLPGVKGIGEKTAASLVQRFGAAEDILAAAQRGADGFPPKAAAAVRDAADYLLAAVGVVRGRTDAPVEPYGTPELATAIPREPADAETLVELSERYALDSAVNRLLAAIGELPA